MIRAWSLSFGDPSPHHNIAVSTYYSAWHYDRIPLSLFFQSLSSVLSPQTATGQTGSSGCQLPVLLRVGPGLAHSCTQSCLCPRYGLSSSLGAPHTVGWKEHFVKEPDSFWNWPMVQKPCPAAPFGDEWFLGLSPVPLLVLTDCQFFSKGHSCSYETAEHPFR
jgi:hypothetical protein